MPDPKQPDHLVARPFDFVRFIERLGAGRILPQHLPYIMSQFGNCSYLLRGEPYPPDAMYEVGAAIRRNPDRPLMFVAEHCMVCLVCDGYDRGGTGLCNVQPRNLVSPFRNRFCNRISLRLLRTLGMEFYQPKNVSRPISSWIRSGGCGPAAGRGPGAP